MKCIMEAWDGRASAGSHARPGPPNAPAGEEEIRWALTLQRRKEPGLGEAVRLGHVTGASAPVRRLNSSLQLFLHHLPLVLR